jgi:hypothetical protein
MMPTEQDLRVARDLEPDEYDRKIADGWVPTWIERYQGRVYLGWERRLMKGEQPLP